MVRRLVILGFALALIVAGCLSTPSPKVSGQVTLPVQAGVTRVEATVKLLNEITVLLPPLTSPGMEWTIVFNDSRFLQERTRIEPSAEGGWKAGFLAVRTGRRLVRFFALPSGVKEASPTQRYEVLITIE